MRGIRGAITVKSNNKDDIIKNTAKLLNTIIDLNNIKQEELVSIIFTATPDLTKEYPAVAARKIGYKNIPLICLQEMAVENSLKMCIRILIYINRECSLDKIEHVYLKDAKKLRPDLVK